MLSIYFEAELFTDLCVVPGDTLEQVNAAGDMSLIDEDMVEVLPCCMVGYTLRFHRRSIFSYAQNKVLLAFIRAK